MKRMLVLFAVLMMMILPAFATEEIQFEYTVLDDGTVALTGYIMPSSTVPTIRIPETIDGKAVSRIEGRIFNSDWMKTITIPDTVTYISGGAFCGCSSDLQLIISNTHPVYATIDGSLYEKATRTLVAGAGKTINVPEGIVAIGDYACFALEADITLPSTVKTIGAHAFEYAKAPVLPLAENVETIGDYAYADFKTEAFDLNIPASVKSIGDYAFADIEVKSLDLPEGLESIGDYAFSDVYYCVGVNTSDSWNHNRYCQEKNAETRELVIEIPSTVTYLGKGVFNKSYTSWEKRAYQCVCADAPKTESSSDSGASGKKAAIIAAADAAMGGGRKKSGVKIQEDGRLIFKIALNDSITKIPEEFVTYSKLAQKVTVYPTAPDGQPIVIDGGAFKKVTVVFEDGDVIKTGNNCAAFEECTIKGNVDLDSAVTLWPYINCSLEYWTGIPDHVTEIGYGACKDPLHDYLHPGLVNIAPNAFTKTSSFIVEPGSYAENWAIDNSIHFDNMQQEADLSWLNPGAVTVAEVKVKEPESYENLYEAYCDAVKLEEAGDLASAIAIYEYLGAYRDCEERLANVAGVHFEGAYNEAVALQEAGEYQAAIAMFETFAFYKDSAEHILACQDGLVEKSYQEAVALLENGEPAQAKAAFEQLAGYKDSDAYYAICGNYVNHPYVFMRAFNGHDLAPVKHKNGKWGYIDKNGNVALEFNYENAYSFSEGMARVVLGKNSKGIVNHMAYIDESGNVACEFEIFGVDGYDFSEGLAAVYFGTEWGFVNKDGERVCKGFDEVSSFMNGSAVVCKDGNWGFIDKNGDYLVETDYYNFSPVGYGLYAASNNSSVGKGIVDSTCAVVYPFELEYGYMNEPGYVRYGSYIDKDGNKIILPIKDAEVMKVEHVPSVNLYKLLDDEGNELLPAEYLSINYDDGKLYLLTQYELKVVPRENVQPDYQEKFAALEQKMADTATAFEAELEQQRMLVEYTDKETVKAVQAALNEAGHNCGTPDGLAGKKTYAALEAYQTEKGLTVTGTITHETLISFGLAS